MMSTWVHC